MKFILSIICSLFLCMNLAYAQENLPAKMDKIQMQMTSLKGRLKLDITQERAIHAYISKVEPAKADLMVKYNALEDLVEKEKIATEFVKLANQEVAFIKTKLNKEQAKLFDDARLVQLFGK